MTTLKIKSEVHVGPPTSFSRFSSFKKDVNESEASAYSAMPNWDTLPWGFLICSLYYNQFCFVFFFFGRWLVLTFKREFPFEDALTMFEIISSQHLELSSMEAERERERQRAKELERDG